MEQKNPKRGGARPGSGRPFKQDSDLYGQITCVLRKDTIQALRSGCGGASKHFGAFLQDHLDRHPLPDRETYLFRQKIKEAQSNGQRRYNPERERYIRQLKKEQREHEKLVKAREREERLQAKMTPKERLERQRRLKKEEQERQRIYKALDKIVAQEAKAAA